MPRLRPMTPADIDQTVAAVLADDWGDRRAWLEFAVAHPECRVVVATGDAGEVVGTGVATISGPVGWLGTIWVAPRMRGRGIGRAITEATIDAAEVAGCRTLLLTATDAGRRLYERMGFDVQTWYLTMEAEGLDAMPSEGQGIAGRIVRPWRPADLDEMAAMDARVTGEDRRHLLAAFATPEAARVVIGPGEVLRGFVVRATWGGGATIAPDPDDAAAILEARRRGAGRGRRVRAGVVADHAAGHARLVATGWTEAWRAPRMIRGTDLTWQPDAIWGQFNHAVG